MAVVRGNLDADRLTEIVDPRSHHTDDMDLTVIAQFDEVADFPAHVTAVLDAALEVVQPLRGLKFFHGKGVEALGSDDYLHGIALGEAPLVFRKEDIAGFDPALVALIAETAGFEYELVNTRWDGIFVALASGEFDMVASAATITDEREEIVDFSNPYFNAGQMIAVLEANADDIAGPDIAEPPSLLEDE